jgi:hypothetical protein
MGGKLTCRARGSTPVSCGYRTARSNSLQQNRPLRVSCTILFSTALHRRWTQPWRNALVDSLNKMIDRVRNRLDVIEKEAREELAKHPQKPPPLYHFDVSHYSDTKCLEMAETCYERWLSVLRRDPQHLIEMGIDVGDDEQKWRRVSFLMGCEFAPLLVKSTRLLIESKVSRENIVATKWWPFFNDGIRGYNNLCTADYGFDAAVERRMLSEFIGGVWNAYFMTVVGSPALGRTPQGWDEFIYASINSINEVSLASRKHEHLLLGAVLTRVLAEWCEQAVRERDDTDFKIRSTLGPFAALDELAQLAARSEFVIKRYGESAIETRFEAQLAILMQSLGFIVIRTERAQRRIDLVCIAPAPAGESYTVLLEAKTTAANYSLPTKDSRAIAEYISSVRSALKSLPPLRLVIIAGNAPAKTVANKIAELEAECDLPIRYCDVRFLQSLRHRLPGPVDYVRFLKTCVTADRILGPQGVNQLVEFDKITRDAHNDFVQTLLTRNSM